MRFCWCDRRPLLAMGYSLFSLAYDVAQDPDGFIYVLTDESNGRLVRLEHS